jgi:hypothetical protein
MLHGTPGDWGALFDLIVTLIPQAIRDWDVAARLLAASRDLTVEWASARALDWLLAGAAGVLAAKWNQIRRALSRIGGRDEEVLPPPPSQPGHRRGVPRSDDPKLPF